MASFRTVGLARAAAGGVALSALMVAAGARADTATPAANGATALGEVIVTAQKRSENLQSTPIAITALTSEKIEQGNVARPVDLQFTVPSMTFGNNDGYSYLTLRGVGLDVTTTAAESSVATYMDGVYTGLTIAESIPTYDLSRIEILRGPQGTLYGRNTTGGVINYITKNPSFEPGANGAISYGNYNALQADVGATGPIVADKIAARFSIHYGDHDGYYDNVALHQQDYSDRNISGRAAILVEPTSKLSVTFRGDMAHDESTDAFALLHSTGLDGVPPGSGLPGLTTPATPLGVFSLSAAQLSALTPAQVQAIPLFPGIPLTVGLFGAGSAGALSPADIAKLGGGSIASYYGLQQPGPAQPNPLATRQLANGAPTLFKADTDGGSATVDWQAGAADVKSISAYRYAQLFFNNDSGGAAAPSVDFSPLNQNDSQFTQEFDVSGKAFDNKLDWLVGAFYFHDEAHFSTTVWLPGISDYLTGSANLFSGPGSPFAFNLGPAQGGPLTNFNSLAAFPPNIYSTVLTNGPNFVGGGPLIARQSIPTTAFLGFSSDQKSQSVAGFFQATYHITDRLRLSGGFRYTDDDKSAVRSLHSNYVAFILGEVGVPAAAGLCDNVRSAKSWTAPTGMVGLDYDAAPHVLTYAKASWGYKAGGLNPGECTHIFNPEYLTDYEGGVKAIFADGQVLTNAAMYYYNYTNIQFTTYVNNASAIENAGSATAFGVELEYAIQPHALPGFAVDGSASFEDSHYGAGCFNDPANLAGPALASNPPVCPAGYQAYAQIKGNELIRAPRWKTNVGAQYTGDLGDLGTWMLRGEAAWTDTIYNDIFNGKATGEADTTQPAYWMVNTRLVWTSLDKRYSAELFANNLGNTFYATNRVGFNTPATVNNVAGQLAPPRTYGIRLAVKFGSSAG